MDKDKVDSKRRVIKMETQMQATPALYGNDAKVVFNEISRKPSKEQRQKLRDNYRKLFEGVKTKGSK